MPLGGGSLVVREGEGGETPKGGDGPARAELGSARTGPFEHSHRPFSDLVECGGWMSFV